MNRTREGAMTNEVANENSARQMQFWNSAASASWVEKQARLDGFFAPLSVAGLTRIGATRGDRVLDVGCGCGDTTLALARAVGPSGTALGVDISAQMLDRARARAAEEGLGHVSYLLSDAGAYPFKKAGFDLVFSRLGVMFFGDAPAAFANLRRAVRPGGRMVFVCPRAPAECAFITVAVTAAKPLLPAGAMPIPGPEDPWMFSLADPARVRRVLNAAGWSDVVLDPLDADMVLEEADGPEAAAAFSLQFGPLPRVLAEAGEVTRAQVIAAIADAYRAMGFKSRVALPGGFWVVSATA
jgi:SAM-dependent methyltransferase